MIKKLTAAFVAITISACAVPWDTNNLSAPLADGSGVYAWPTNPIVNAVVVTNYAGGGWYVRLGQGSAIWATNLDDGTTLLAQTNGLLKMTQTNGWSLLYTNGALSVSSNGTPVGSMTAASLVGSLSWTNLVDTNRPWSSTSNPTNQFAVGTLYTNSGARGLLVGYASGTVLSYTNSGVGYTLPVTNAFSIPLSTNATFKFASAGFLTNTVIFK